MFSVGSGSFAGASGAFYGLPLKRARSKRLFEPARCRQCARRGCSNLLRCRLCAQSGFYRRFSCKGAFWGLPGAFAVPSPLQSAGAARALKMAVRPCSGAASALKKAARAA